MWKHPKKQREELMALVEATKRPDFSDGRGWSPTNISDGMPRMMLTWVTNSEGQSGFSVDTWSVPAKDILNFYAGAATTVAMHAMNMKGKADATADTLSQTADEPRHAPRGA